MVDERSQAASSVPEWSDGALALEKTTMADADAEKEHTYLRRAPACAAPGAADAALMPKLLHQIWWQGEAAVPPE